LQAIASICRQLHAIAWQLQAIAGNYKQLQAIASNYKQLQAITNSCKQLQATAGMNACRHAGMPATANSCK